MESDWYDLVSRLLEIIPVDDNRKGMGERVRKANTGVRRHGGTEGHSLKQKRLQQKKKETAIQACRSQAGWWTEKMLGKSALRMRQTV